MIFFSSKSNSYSNPLSRTLNYWYGESMCPLQSTLCSISMYLNIIKYANNYTIILFDNVLLY